MLVIVGDGLHWFWCVFLRMSANLVAVFSAARNQLIDHFGAIALFARSRQSRKILDMLKCNMEHY